MLYEEIGTGRFLSLQMVFHESRLFFHSSVEKFFCVVTVLGMNPFVVNGA